jgi:hypothetical protein
MSKILYATAAAAALFAFNQTALAQANNVPDKKSLAAVIDDTYDCQLIKPMFAQTDDSSTRVGAILNGVVIDRANSSFVDLRLATPDEYCTPDYPVPSAPPDAWALTNYTYVNAADLSIKAEFTKFLNLATLDFSYLKEVDFAITEPKVYQINSEKRRQAASQISKKQDCKPALRTLKPKANYINYPILITNTCVGKVNLNFTFNRAVSGSVVALQIAQLKLGLSFDLKETLGKEVNCPADGAKKPPAGAADSKTSATSVNNAGKQAIAAVTKAISDYAAKVASEADTKATNATKAGAADAGAKKTAATNAKASSDAAKQAVQSADAVSIPIAGKCYEGVTLSSATPIVFGVSYKRADLYLPK